MVRDIRDLSSGARWVLFRDPAHPGGPGKLLLVSDRDSSNERAIRHLPSPESFNPVIRAGDTITIEIHTPSADAWVRAFALNPARQGAPVLARVFIGGGTVHALAAGQGRATLVTTEAWR